MKKLLAFAVIAAMSFGAYAGCSDEVGESECGYVWKFRASARTLSPATKSINHRNPHDCISACYRRQGTLRFEGFFWYCGPCECTAFETAMEGTGVIWTGPTRYRNGFIWGAPDGVATIDTGDGFVNRFDARASKVQLLGDLNVGEDFIWRIAGFGAFSKDKVMGLRGYFAGKLPAYLFPCASDPCSDQTENSIVWNLCPTDGDSLDLSADGDDAILDAPSAAYGNWSLSLDRRLSGRILMHGDPTDVIPSFTDEYEMGL